MRYLTVQEIVDTNRKIILRTGGFVEGAGRLANPNSLEYLVEIVQTKLGEDEVYPSLPEKAAAYAFHIITRHIFLDGNKRTGMTCTFLFLRLNGYRLVGSVTEDEIVELALMIAKKAIDIHNLAIWIQERLEE